MKIWLDDVRDPPDDGWIVARSYLQFRFICSHLSNGPPFDLVSFDHDLGDEKDGYDCIKLLASDFPLIYPAAIEVHSANPVGAENILRYDEWYRRMRAEMLAALDKAAEEHAE